MYKIKFLSFLLCLFLPIILCGQEIRQNEIGERIIVFPDGTWRYFHKRQLSGGNYPVVNHEVTPLDNPIEITREEVYQLVNRRIQQAKDAMYYADIRAKAMAEQEKELQNKIADAQKNSLVPADELNKLLNQLTLTQQLAATSLGTIKEAQSDLLITQDLKMKGDILRLFKTETSPGKLELNTVFASRFSPGF